MSGTEQGGRGDSSRRVVSTFPQKQWAIFERICQDQANMDGRRALKHLVAQCAMTGYFPMTNPPLERQEMMAMEDETDAE